MKKYRFFFLGKKYEGIYCEDYIHTTCGKSIPFKKTKGRKIISKTISTNLPKF